MTRATKLGTHDHSASHDASAARGSGSGRAAGLATNSLANGSRSSPNRAYRSVSTFSAYSEPTAMKIHPIALRGWRAATAAPTNGKAIMTSGSVNASFSGSPIRQPTHDCC